MAPSRRNPLGARGLRPVSRVARRRRWHRIASSSRLGSAPQAPCARPRGLLPRAAEHPRIALTRTYFAVFHAVRARLFDQGLEPKTHAGVHHLWNLHLVKPGTYPAATSRLLARLQKYREEADYAREFVVDEAGAREELAAAKGLVERIRGELT